MYIFKLNLFSQLRFTPGRLHVCHMCCTRARVSLREIANSGGSASGGGRHYDLLLLLYGSRRSVGDGAPPATGEERTQRDH